MKWFKFRFAHARIVPFGSRVRNFNEMSKLKHEFGSVFRVLSKTTVYFSELKLLLIVL